MLELLRHAQHGSQAFLSDAQLAAGCHFVVPPRVAYRANPASLD